ncbi:hypothetical protein [Desulforamulus aquiferis]|uniref:Uncharacterized protein n=1 Tax=Desulforamulus aquiferis TaxID=1397668 RepID=A0AAW7Z932_9FIRM|nr:hypothetical protein [Desulforamulus aquiferis]MDO7785803.1 hypothetical protein [Desulforamulus aquiferis]
MIKTLKEVLQDQRGISQLVVLAILCAVGGTIAFGMFYSWAPKLKNLTERGQSVLGN